MRGFAGALLFHASWVAALCALGTSACGRIGFEAHGADAGQDAALEAGPMDAGSDVMQPPDGAHADAGRDADVTDAAPLDADTRDAEADAAGLDATVSDAASEASTGDASDDAMTDGGPDAMAEGGVDAGPIEPVFPLVPARALSTVGYHTCVLHNQQLACWGRNEHGQLGVGDQIARDTATRVTLPNNATPAQISTGEHHTCALDTQRRVYCWGRNHFGQLGLGDMQDRSTPTEVTALRDVVQLAGGYGFTCAITADNALHCWGDNAEGQLGLDDTSAPIAFVTTPTPTSGFHDWIQIEPGQGRACGLRAPGVLWCAGRHGFYGFGNGLNQPPQVRAWTQSSSETNWTYISISQDGGCGLRADNLAYCWGTFASTPATVLMTHNLVNMATWIAGAAGVFNACGIQTPRTLHCWGRNVEGQLGTGDWIDQTGAPVIGSDSDWNAVVLGRFHTCAQKLDGRVYCTGENADGQLGLGDRMRRNVFTQVSLP